MSIGEILLGFVVGGGVGGGASYFLQKGRISEIAGRYEQKSSQVRQALEAAEAELEEKKTQLFAVSQSEARVKNELQNLEINYQNHLEQIERSKEAQLANHSSVGVSPELEIELEQAKAQIRDYQTQILELQQAVTPLDDHSRIQEIEQQYQTYIDELQQTYSAQLQEIEGYKTQILELQQAATPTADLEATHTRIQEIEQHHQTYIEELQQIYSTQLQEIESAHQTEKQEQQQTYSTQFQEIEQAYQNQIVELEKTHQNQIRELEQAYQAQMLELQQLDSEIEQPSTQMSENPDEFVPPSQFTEPWDEDFSKATLLEMSFTQPEEEIAEISNLEELVDLTSEISEEPFQMPVNAREQDEFFASQTLIGDIDFLKSEQNDEPAQIPVNAREQAEFFASQTLIGDIDFLESEQNNESNLIVSENALIQDELFQNANIEVANADLEDLSQPESFFNQTLVDEMDFLESLEFEPQDKDIRFEDEDLASISDEFFINERTATEEDFSNLVLTPEEMKADLNEPFSLELKNPFELVDEQSIDLDLFDSFEPSKSNELDLNDEKLEEFQANGNKNVVKTELDDEPSDPDLDFFNMLEKENPKNSESLDIDDKDVNLEDLFSEDLFRSDWKSSSKN
ncbi:hypothetical protein C7H19_02515 [Aphanothece hegewaldii CCALA 016]|uniref:Uncharacterized protein n=1 Tax=Aphanothece hegewaldii CCALA 016 TaxID=2107694 RepID=A0A2T1M2N9_9CHRO|nr:hypothetical protein [Aphanothece hegewaldii]PSF38947.1 hypothetical protein C7H19_02515 [Aphanothece hegewaldii CCALA 016]